MPTYDKIIKEMETLSSRAELKEYLLDFLQPRLETYMQPLKTVT
jgi:hypothetical protein